ncbi:penicillin-binding protein 2 [Acidithiobacillus sp. AMEEHan]|uniref:peptidoglycan D,D-transpeptidase FtsI family protein n=1 Tax=Acidithiobacillus sp. AMEEHan TaxID=2994951 RepID=UPI0027E47B29|nr:penicillin-binding protein 2 [Acidithiobacillus sp. AMEEHan]
MSTLAQAPLPVWRPRLIFGMLGAGFCAILYQSWQTQVEQSGFLRAQGQQRYQRQLPLPAPARGEIFDRDGRALALSVPSSTLWVDPKVFAQQQARWPELAKVLGISPAEIGKRLQHSGSAFAYLLRQIDPQLAARALALGIPGLHEMQEYRRFYPSGQITGPLLGFTNIEGVGSEGLELAYDHVLRSRAGQREVLRDNHGHLLSSAPEHISHSGQPLTLTIDRRLQYAAYTALAAAVQRFAARSGSAVLLDAHSGAILAMVNYPASNPNDREHYDPAGATDRAITHTFEPGSVMKPFAVAAALDSGSIQATSHFDVNTNCFRVANYCIQDDARHGTLDIGQILKYSSNIGAAKIALRTPAPDLYGLLSRAGFGQSVGLGLPGESAGRLPADQQWGPAAHAAIAYGYGISVNTLQLAAAYAAIANDGVYVTPHLLLGQRSNERQVMSASTAADLRKWLAGVVAPGGTGFLAAIPGYTVAGKTGTAAMANGKGGFHRHQVNTSFVGFAPAQNPRFVMAVTVRDPTQGWRYGGVVAAPVFRSTMSVALRNAGIPPQGGTAQAIRPRSLAEQQRWAEGAGDVQH